MKKLFLAILFSLSIVVVSGQEKFPFQNMNLSFEERASDLISRMTLKEKVSQLTSSAAAIPRFGIKPYGWWNEGLHGVARNGRATVFPQAIGMAATFDTTLIYNVANAISDEARAKFNVSQKMNNYRQYAGLTLWSPNVNIFRDPRWGRGQETYGEDPYLTSRIGVAFVKGLQGNDPKYLKTAACAKHYVVHSGPEALRHQFDVSPTKKDLYETYLPAFKALVQEANVEAVMGAYNRVYGESASGSKYLLKDILRDDWGFTGHVVSDCGAIDDIWKHHKIAKDVAEANAIAVKAGLNINCGSSYRELEQSINRGLITEADIDELLFPSVMTKMKLGMFDPTEANKYNSIPESVVGSKEHVAIARQAAVESIVMLQNRDNVLPLSKNINKLLITGPYVADVYSLLGNYYGVNSDMKTILEGVSGRISLGTTLDYKYGVQATTPNKSNPGGGATGISKNSDATIVVLGINGLLEGEAGDAISSEHQGDRLDYSIPAHQIEYLRLLRDGNTKPIIAVIMGGSPMDLNKVSEYADAVLLAWYPGQEGGDAVADIIFGDKSPSGRLPLTFPKTLSTLPDYKDYSMKGRTYKYMDNSNILYPFGMGITYTKFEYSPITISSPVVSNQRDVTLSIDIKNIGKVACTEVVQLYVATPGAGSVNPQNSLIDFSRITIAAGESKTATFVVPVQKLYSVSEQGESVLLKGDYTLSISGAAPCQRSTKLEVPISTTSLKVK